MHLYLEGRGRSVPAGPMQRSCPAAQSDVEWQLRGKQCSSIQGSDEGSDKMERGVPQKRRRMLDPAITLSPFREVCNQVHRPISEQGGLQGCTEPRLT